MLRKPPENFVQFAEAKKTAKKVHFSREETKLRGFGGVSKTEVPPLRTALLYMKAEKC